ncbi:MAG TPA: hypothetical protein VFA70_05305 [Dehalococcoidia bacterium]|jgi:hypothetical protein|nr:hypothetical protein [Dehalococcoidia bacterium]
MTKLADAIRRTTRAEAPRIGFTPAPVKRQPTMLLVALVATPNEAAAGADALLAQSDAPLTSTNGAAEQPLRGLMLKGDGDVAAAREQGYDFVVFDGDEAPASVLLEEKAGLVMQVPSDLTDTLLQTLQWLPLDALMVRWEGTLTVRRQLELQRLSGFSRKPLFLFLDADRSAAELEALREAGVIGVVVDLTRSGGAERLAGLRTTIDGLRPRPKRGRDESPIVSIAPMFVGAPEREPEEPDEDEE